MPDYVKSCADVVLDHPVARVASWCEDVLRASGDRWIPPSMQIAQFADNRRVLVPGDGQRADPRGVNATESTLAGLLVEGWNACLPGAHHRPGGDYVGLGDLGVVVGAGDCARGAGHAVALGWAVRGARPVDHGHGRRHGRTSHSSAGMICACTGRVACHWVVLDEAHVPLATPPHEGHRAQGHRIRLVTYSRQGSQLDDSRFDVV